VAIIALVALIVIVFISEYQKQKELDDRLDRIKEYVELNSEDRNVFRETELVKQENEDERRLMCEKMFLEEMLRGDEKTLIQNWEMNTNEEKTVYHYCIERDMRLAIDVSCIYETGSRTGLNFMNCVDEQNQKLTSLKP